jgi:hypothetical protein
MLNSGCSVIFGPLRQPLKSLSEINQSTAYIWDIANGKYKDGIRLLSFPVYVGSGDVALAHVRAIEADVARNNRYLLIGGNFVCLVYPQLVLTDRLIGILGRRRYRGHNQ